MADQSSNSERASIPLSGDNLTALLKSKNYDQIDFGCSKGGSLQFGRDVLGGKNGIGLDIDPAKVKQTNEAGFEGALADVTELVAQRNSARFVTMIDFLEHLPGVEMAERCIEAACQAAKDFVFIRQPWFDSDGYLFSRGLKLYWSDWTGHPNAMTSLELYRTISRVSSAKRWRIYARTLVESSSDPCVHPIDAPANQHDYDVQVHGQKPSISFEQPIYRQIGAIILTEDNEELLADIEQKTRWTEVLFDSSGVVGNFKKEPKDSSRKRKLAGFFGRQSG